MLKGTQDARDHVDRNLVLEVDKKFRTLNAHLSAYPIPSLPQYTTPPPLPRSCLRDMVKQKAKQAKQARQYKMYDHRAEKSQVSSRTINFNKRTRHVEVERKVIAVNIDAPALAAAETYMDLEPVVQRIHEGNVGVVLTRKHHKRYVNSVRRFPYLDFIFSDVFHRCRRMPHLLHGFGIETTILRSCCVGREEAQVEGRRAARDVTQVVPCIVAWIVCQV